jgi:GT2 family glycosyltransferase
MGQLSFESAAALANREAAQEDVGLGVHRNELPKKLSIAQRPTVRGKFLFVGDEKFWIKGVTYGTFRPDANGNDFPGPAVVHSDMAAMARAGLNSIRVYTAPPRWFLDLASCYDLRVMVGLPWEQHIAFLDERSHQQRIVRTLREAVRLCAAHPAVLCYTIGNEIPASVVRWSSHQKVAAFLKQIAKVVRQEDPGSLVTYVNYPTTEYLELDFIDFVAFNVYLESKDRLAAYLARLQNLAGDRPLLMAEIGLDSRRNGEHSQSDVLAWQIETAFEGGCIGAFVFAWTDEWHRGGFDIEDWDFGLTSRNRKPKPALDAVSRAFADAPFSNDRIWPKISVVVCSYNGSRTIGETLTRLKGLNYPDYEIIVVDDGSSDKVSEIASIHEVCLIRQENLGLSAARNSGLAAARGEIVAYIDDDAYPDADWLSYLAAAFQAAPYAGVGGPNLSPADDGRIAACVANAPGGPVHVLLTDSIAEHIPGCNMAFRRDCLEAVGGFDPRFRVAGDDVDLCWRLQDRGWKLGFSPAALVWHHRRASVRSYLRQQRGYAKAEALLAEKWPSKYNSAGHLSWQGRLYGRGNMRTLLQRPRIYHGTWGSALFQSVYEPAHRHLFYWTLMPEWYALLLSLGAAVVLGFVWAPMVAFAAPFFVGVILTLIQAAQSARRAALDAVLRTSAWRLPLIAIVASLHLLQPAARLLGRVQHGLGPCGWRRGKCRLQLSQREAIWCERWAASEDRLREIERLLCEYGAVVERGGDFDRWDFVVRGGLFGSVRVQTMIEEHGAGRQMFRLRAWPQVPTTTIVIIILLATTASIAGYDQAWSAAIALAVGAAALCYSAYRDCGIASRYWFDAVAAYSRLEHSRR